MFEHNTALQYSTSQHSTSQHSMTGTQSQLTWTSKFSLFGQARALEMDSMNFFVSGPTAIPNGDNQRFENSSEDRTTCHILYISILNEASSNAPSSMESVAWTEIYSTYLSDSFPNSINSDHSTHLFKSMRGVFPMIFVYGGNSVNQIPCPKYRYLFTVWIDVRS